MPSVRRNLLCSFQLLHDPTVDAAVVTADVSVVACTGSQLELDVTAGLLALGPPRPNLSSILADPTKLGNDPVLAHFRPVANPRCWHEYVTLLHVRQLDAAAGRTPLPPGCPPGSKYLQHMCEQLGMLTQSGLAHSTKPVKTTPKSSGSGKHNAAADAEGELFWPRLRVLTEKAHWAMTILEGLRRFGLLDGELATSAGTAGAGQDAGPLHIHIIGAQDNKDEGATTAATFR